MVMLFVAFLSGILLYLIGSALEKGQQEKNARELDAIYRKRYPR